MNKELLKQIILDNQTEISEIQLIKRNFSFEENANYIFVGIRRAGKSYLLYQRIHELLSNGKTWKDILFVNFEDERLSEFSAVDFNLLLEIHLEKYAQKPMLFLDEIQLISGWEKFARRLADTGYQIYITGSNAKMLSSEMMTTLGGRFLTVDVFPYSLQEFLSANDFTLTDDTLFSTKRKSEFLRLFNEFFYNGGLPETLKFDDKRNYLTSVYKKIFLGDIATRHSIDNVNALRVMFKKIAESVKQPQSYNRIANIVSSTGTKITTHTVINYIQYSIDAWLINRIHNYAGKLADKESNPKYYFTDNGVLKLLLFDTETSLLENIVAVNLLRKYGRDDAVFFYKNNVEVDFYIPEEELAIQVCYNLYNDDGTLERELNALLKLSKLYPCKKMFVVTFGEEKEFELENLKIKAIPVWKWLLSLRM
ncbi:MAG: ATP-binding protein [Dysgonamonadaceae bacterium]|jgi:predicted AAA+ superfamily ATPase|nr:ATP-binding protein [Dysgonamonadaceae bacterium]